MRRLRIISGLIVISICVILLADSGINQVQSREERISQMPNLSEDEWIGLLGELIEERTHVRYKLEQQLSNTENTIDIRAASAFLLGRYRMQESVPVLSRYITLRTRIRQNGKEFYWDRYPVLEALGRIGRPAVPEMLNIIKTSNDEKAHEFAVLIILGVEGSQVGGDILKGELEKQTTPQDKDKFKKAIAVFNEWVEKKKPKPSTE